MTELVVTPDLEAAPWRDLAGRLLGGSIVEHPGGALMPKIVRVGLLRNGTVGERATLTIAVELPGGAIVLAETTLRLARTAALALAASPAFAEETFE